MFKPGSLNKAVQDEDSWEVNRLLTLCKTSTDVDDISDGRTALMTAAAGRDCVILQLVWDTYARLENCDLSGVLLCELPYGVAGHWSVLMHACHGGNLDTLNLVFEIYKEVFGTDLQDKVGRQIDINFVNGTVKYLVTLELGTKFPDAKASQTLKRGATSISLDPGDNTTNRRLSDDSVRSIFEFLHCQKPLPPHLNFSIVPTSVGGFKLSPPPYEFERGYRF